MVRDFSAYGLDLLGKPTTNEPQQVASRKMIKRPVADADKFNRVLNNNVYSLIDAYKMNE
jgi:acyl-CoA dehydrogenase